MKRIERATSIDDKGYVLPPFCEGELRISNRTENPVQCEQRLLRERIVEQQQQEQQQRCTGSLRMSDTDEHVTLEEVELAYMECRKNKRNSRGALEYEMSYETNNYRLWHDLNDMTYEIGSSICFCVTRPKLREVFAADFRDRIVHHIIMRKFLWAFEAEMIDDSYNCRKGKGVMYAVRRIQKHITDVSQNYTEEAWVLKCDLQGFFMSIDRDILWRMIEDVVSRHCGKDLDWWLWLIKKVVYHRPEQKCERHGDLSLWDRLEPHKSLFKSGGKGLPIGNLTSQIFANFYMTKFDKWVQSRIGDGSRYGRFVDDFIIVSRDKHILLTILSEARIWLHNELGLSLHPRKVYLQEVKKGVEFVGTVIKPCRRYSNNRTISNAFAAVMDYNNGIDNINRFVTRYNSYMGFLIHNNTYGIRWNIWKSVRNRKGIYCSNMKKIVIINKNRHFEQTDDGILVAEWLNNEERYELHQDNDCF